MQRRIGPHWRAICQSERASVHAVTPWRCAHVRSPPLCALSRCLIHVIQMHRGWSGYIGRWGLFDGDGAETKAWDGARLFKNNGDGTFEQVSAPI